MMKSSIVLFPHVCGSMIVQILSYEIVHYAILGLSQGLETAWPKLAILKYLGILYFLRETTIYSDYNLKYVLTY